MESESAFTQKIQVFQLKRMNFGFVRLIFITKDGIEHEKITYYFVTGNVRPLCPSLRKDGFS